MLRETSARLYQQGHWRLIEPGQIHPADATYKDLLVYSWMGDRDFRLVVINLSGEWARARIEPEDCPRLGNGPWLQYDILSESFARLSGEALNQRGLELEAPPYGAHIFRFDRESG